MMQRPDLALAQALASTATHALARWSWLAVSALALTTLVACGDDGATGDDGGSGTAGQGEACSTNDDCASGLLCVAQVCQGSSTNNTTSTNGGTTSTNNSSTGTNNGTTSTNNGTSTSTNNTTTTPPDDAGNNDPNDVGTPDVGDDVAPDTPPDDDVGAPRPDRLVGGVSLFEVDVSAGFLFSLERGNFGAAFTEPQSEAAPIATFGSCDVISVSTNEPPAPFGYDAGAITINGTGVNYTMQPSTAAGGSVSYSSGLSEDNENAYPPNTPLQINAAGGAHIGPFNGAVTTPGEHSMNSPQADARVSNDALTVTWAPANTSNAVLISAVPLDSFFGAINGNGVSCTVPSDSGSFVIPAEAMGMLAGPRLAITVIKASNTTVNVGPDELILNVTYAAGNVVQK